MFNLSDLRSNFLSHWDWRPKVPGISRCRCSAPAMRNWFFATKTSDVKTYWKTNSKYHHFLQTRLQKEVVEEACEIAFCGPTYRSLVLDLLIPKNLSIDLNDEDSSGRFHDQDFDRHLKVKSNNSNVVQFHHSAPRGILLGVVLKHFYPLLPAPDLSLPGSASNKGWVKAKVNFWPRDRPLAHAELVFCLAH